MRWKGTNICQMISQKPKFCKNFERNSHWRKLSMIMLWERYCNASPKPEFFFIFCVYSFIHISAKYKSVWVEILHTETSKLMYNWSFLFVVLHQPTLLPSTFNHNYCMSYAWFSSVLHIVKWLKLIQFCEIGIIKVIVTCTWKLTAINTIDTA